MSLLKKSVDVSITQPILVFVGGFLSTDQNSVKYHGKVIPREKIKGKK
jgi:hypothetical protein